MPSNMGSSTKWVKARESFDLQAKELILPLSVLKDARADFSNGCCK